MNVKDKVKINHRHSIEWGESTWDKDDTSIRNRINTEDGKFNKSASSEIPMYDFHRMIIETIRRKHYTLSELEKIETAIKTIKSVMLILLMISGVLQTNAQNWDEMQKIVASDRGSADQFGQPVCVSGTYAIVGAGFEDEDTVGGNTLNGAGSAYIFERDSVSGTWNEVQKIIASDRAVDDWFGYAVSINGNYAIVGAVYEDEDATGGNSMGFAGSAYIFERDENGNWEEVQKIVASDRATLDYFGYSVSISGSYAIVGDWKEAEDALGNNTLSAAGSAYIFERDTISGIWNEAQKIVASDRDQGDEFGNAVSISGDFIIVGAEREDHDASGSNILTSSGSSYIFERDSISGVWNEVQKIVSTDRGSGDYFGMSVNIDSHLLIIGAYAEDENQVGGNTMSEAGSAYIFTRDSLSGVWTQSEKLVASDRASFDKFGFTVSISGDYAAVGAFQEDENSTGGNTMNSAGSAYIFKKDVNDNWNQVQKIVPSDRDATDIFGQSVSISGTYIIVGAKNEDENSSGSNTLNDAGSAYVFEIAQSICTAYDTIFTTIYDTTLITVYDTTLITIMDTNYITVTDTLIIDIETGLSPPNNINIIKVFPNPTNDIITIDNGDLSTIFGYEIIIQNSLSQVQFQSTINQQQFTIDLSTWTGNGLYFLYIIDDTGNTIDVKKIILQ